MIIQKTKKIIKNINPYFMKNSINHISITVAKTFEKFTAGFESALGSFDHDAMKLIKQDPEKARAAIEKMQGIVGLMVFTIEDHGTVLLLEGQVKKVKQYRVGNPLIAMTMTMHDLRAALYVPLSIVIYENTDGVVTVDYDQPSSLLGQFENQEILKVAESLDQKLIDLINIADN